METQAKLYIQDLIQQGRLELITSYMLRYACSQNPYEMRRKAIMQFIDIHTMGYVGLERKDTIESMPQKL